MGGNSWRAGNGNASRALAARAQRAAPGRPAEEEDQFPQGDAGGLEAGAAAEMAAAAGPGAGGHQSRCRPDAAFRIQAVCQSGAPATSGRQAHAPGDCRVYRHDHPGHHVVFQHAIVVQGGAAHDRGTAPAGAAACGPSVGQLLRREPHRPAGIAHHERRRGRAQPHWHGPGGVCRRPAHCGHGIRLPHAPQPAV